MVSARHWIIDNFLDPIKAQKIAEEFPPYDSDRWMVYNNPVENKSTCEDWRVFGPETYKFFIEANSPKMVGWAAALVGCPIHPDYGLHGGGMHIHGIDGNLNPHLDYEIHPQMELRRKINLIVYLSDLKDEEGGRLGFWEDCGQLPGKLLTEVEVKFNRAVLFETDRMWHGMSWPMKVGAGVYRKSLAAYYLTDNDGRGGARRARFVARRGQKVDKKFLEERARLVPQTGLEPVK